MVIKIMAQNSDFESEEREQQTENCPAAIVNAIPSHCQKVLFSQFETSGNYMNKAIIGKLCQINPLGKRPNGYSRKLQITDALSQEEPQKKLTVYLLDEFAQDSEAAHLGGFLIITNFLLEKSTNHKKDELPFQILVQKESQVLFGKKIPTPASGNSKKSRHSAPKKRTKVQNEDESHQILSNHYDYTSLGNLQENEQFCFNVYGIVDKCSLKVTQVKKTQVLDLVLTDETETGFICSIFAAKDETFPDVYPGDIIRIHRMQAYKFRSRLKGKCLSPYFILVFSKSDQGHKAKTVAKSFTFTDEDSDRVNELFSWYNKKSEPKLISEINRGDSANIVCQVIGVYCAKTTDAVILKIWDGTRTNQFESTHWGLREEILDEKLFLIAKSYYVVLSVYGQHTAIAAELKPGQFIEVLDANLYSPKTNPDDCKLCVHTGTKENRGINVLDPEDEKVKNLKQRLEKIILDTQTIGNDTDDLLSENNSVFLNCDISQIGSSQKTTTNKEETDAILPSSNGQISPIDEERDVDVEALNTPLASRSEEQVLSRNAVISVTEAGIKPGQCTQEFGEGTQRDMQEMDISEEPRAAVTSESDPVLNKTPVEFRMFLHNPFACLNAASSQSSPSFFPFTSDTEEEWWNSVTTVSETVGHSSVKPSTLAEVISQEIPRQFRTFCIVMAFEPHNSTIIQLIHLCCPKCLYITEDAAPDIEPFEERDGLFYFYCPECRKQGVEKQNLPILEYNFLISFDLHDGTGPSKLEVLLWKENAVQFFKGITAEEALRNTTAAQRIYDMLWTICPNCRPYNSIERKDNNYTVDPVLDCCIVSYTTPSGPKYQMFDTKLK